jgi:phage terminase small subunit
MFNKVTVFGYSEKTAKSQGQRLLTHVAIQRALSKELEQRSNRCEINADHVLNRLVKIDEMDLLDILNENGTIKPVSQWPKIWRQYLSGIDVSELYQGKNEEKVMTGILKKIKWPDKLKNLELIGKHLGMWTENKDHKHKHTFANPDGTPLRYSVVTNYVSPEDLNK